MSTKKAKKDAENLSAVIEKIPQMFGERTAIGQRLHEIIMAAAPELKPRLWYGMPGYAKDGPVLVFFRKDKYANADIHQYADDFRSQRKSEHQPRGRRDRSAHAKRMVPH